jgi:hypothetical protein
MCEELNLISASAIEFAEADVLLGDISILDSFKQERWHDYDLHRDPGNNTPLRAPDGLFLGCRI